MWQCDLVTLTLTLVLKIENGKENKKENKNRKEKENKLSPLLLSLTNRSRDVDKITTDSIT